MSVARERFLPSLNRIPHSFQSQATLQRGEEMEGSALRLDVVSRLPGTWTSGPGLESSEGPSHRGFKRAEKGAATVEVCIQ